MDNNNELNNQQIEQSNNISSNVQPIDNSNNIDAYSTQTIEQSDVNYNNTVSTVVENDNAIQNVEVPTNVDSYSNEQQVVENVVNDVTSVSNVDTTNEVNTESAVQSTEQNYYSQQNNYMQPSMNSNVQPQMYNNVGVQQAQPVMQNNYQMYNGVLPTQNGQMPLGQPAPKKKSGLLKFVGIVLGVFFALIVLVAVFGDTKAPSTDVELQSGFDKIYTAADGTVRYIDSSYFEGFVVTNAKSALSAFDKVKDVMNFDKGSSEFSLYKTTTNGGLTYYKFQQIFNYRKIDRYMTLVVDSSGKVKELIGNYVSNASPSPSKFLSEEEIINLFKNVYGEDAEISDVEEYVAEDGVTSLASAIVITSEKIIRAVINEDTNTILSETSLIEEIEVSGVSFSDSSLSYTDRDGEENTINVGMGSKTGQNYVKYFDSTRNITLGDGEGITYDNIETRIMDLYYNKRDSYLVKEEENDLLFNQTMKTYEDIYDFYYSNYGWKSYDNKGGLIAVFPNTSVRSNAFWLGDVFNMMFIGYGWNKDDSLVYGTDILTHEFTHGVINYTAEFSADCGVDGTLPNDPGALNEAFADIMGMAFDDEDWTVGEEANFEVRDASNPNKYSNPISTSDKYYFPQLNGKAPKEYLNSKGLDSFCSSSTDNGGVHTNSEIVTHSAYLMYENNVFENKIEMGRVFFSALHRLNKNSRFEDAAIAVIASAKDLGYSSDKLDIMYSVFKQTGML